MLVEVEGIDGQYDVKRPRRWKGVDMIIWFFNFFWLVCRLHRFFELFV